MNIKKWAKFAAMFLLPILLAFQVANDPDVRIFFEKISQVSATKSLPARTLDFSQTFLGTPYQAGTLESDGQEALVTNLRGLDCWTLVENALAIALAQTVSTETSEQWTAYQNQLRQLRYRGGKIEGYGSRIHYFSEWLIQAEKNGILRDITREIGGKPYTKKVAFMTNNPNLYPKMAEKATREAVSAGEKRIAQRRFFEIQKSEVAQKEHLIQDGDIIAVTSTKADLDVVHEGFACWHNGRVHLFHASSDAKKVILSAVPLADYLAKNKSQSGIMVARIQSNSKPDLK